MDSIFIIGKICSGKSTLSTELSEKLNAPVISFSAYLKHLCTSKNLEICRENLQDIGQNLVEHDPEGFLRSIIEFQVSDEVDCVLIEGIRHKSILTALKHISNNCSGIYLEIPIEVRTERYAKREGKIITPNDLEKIEAHKAESEIEDLKALCDFVLTEDSSLSDIIDRLNT